MISYSIVISVYNQRQSLEMILSSLAAQVKSPKIFEVVITDDGSTDGTAEFVKKARFPIFMKYIRAQGGVGRAENRNRGFAKTVGGQVIFLDGDMVPDPGLIESYLAIWGKYPRDAVVGSVRSPEEWERDRLQRYLYSRGRLSQKKESIIPGRYFTSNNFSVNKETFDKLSGFDTSFEGWGGEDTDFGLRLESAGVSIRYNPEAICRHYHRRTLDEIINEFENYGRTGYRCLVEKHPQSVIFPSGWMLGLSDSRPGIIKRIIAGCLSPLRSDQGISVARSLAGGGIPGNFIFDWLFYGCLARGYRKG